MAWTTKRTTNKEGGMVSRPKVAVESKGEIVPKRAPGEPLSTIYVGSMTLNASEQVRAEFCKYPNAWVTKLCRGFINQRGEFAYTKKQISFSVKSLPDLVTLLRKALKQATRDGLLPDKKGE
jgi:hypothetical protein